MVMSISKWNDKCNTGELLSVYKCHNQLKHKLSMAFNNLGDWQKHAHDCYDHKEVASVLSKARL